jgi:hypothetical protein
VPDLPAKFKLFLVSYGAEGSSNNLQPSISGGSWIEVGIFDEASLKDATSNIGSTDIGGLPGPNTGILIKAVWVKVA